MKESISILIADDHYMIRQGIIKCIHSRSAHKIIGEAADGLDVIEKSRMLKPDIILMDINMPKKDGLSATKMILQEDNTKKIIILTAHNDDVHLSDYIHLGAKGYILKNTRIEDLIHAIETVYLGGEYFDPEIRTVIEDKRNVLKNKIEDSDIPLTPKELVVLKLIAEGNSIKEISEKLCVSQKTIDSHRENMKEKLGINSTVGLVRYAIEKGIVKLQN
jgi:DNA-binding NarL/FixJ family response regulator